MKTNESSTLFFDFDPSKIVLDEVFNVKTKDAFFYIFPDKTGKLCLVISLDDLNTNNQALAMIKEYFGLDESFIVSSVSVIHFLVFAFSHPKLKLFGKMYRSIDNSFLLALYK